MKKQRIGKSKSNENNVIYVVDKKDRILDPTRRIGHVLMINIAILIINMVLKGLNLS